ncbi:FHA domain-containing protein [bacterium]|nr:FHA domain-containing protein [bacterium]
MAASREKNARLVVIEGKDNRDKGKIISLKKSYVIIGRGQADIVLNDLQVSRAHVALEWNEKNGELTFTDLGSTNGTLVNGELRKSGVLKDRDRLKVGHTVFDCQLEHESQTEIGTLAQFKQEGQLSKSSSVSLAGPSRFSSNSERIAAQPVSPDSKDSKNLAASHSTSEPAVNINSPQVNSSKQVIRPRRAIQVGAISLAFLVVLLVKLSDSPRRSISNKTLEDYVTQVTSLTDEKRLDDAKTACIEAQKAFPNHSVPLVLLGNVYFKQNKFDLSVDAYRRSLKLAPVQLITYPRLIRLYWILNKKQDATKLFADFIPLLDSGNAKPNIFIQTGELLLDYPELEPNTEKALKWAKELQTKKAPNDPIGFKLESHILYSSNKNNETARQAEEILKKGLSLSPKDDWIYDRLVYLKLTHSSSLEATIALESWLKANPKSAKALMNFAYLRFNDKKFLEAVPYLQKVMNILAKEPTEPLYSEALNLMGNISMQQNQLAEAENFLRQSCQYGFKPSCSHPLLIGAPLISKEDNSAYQDLNLKNREPGSSPAETSPLNKK